MSRPRKKKGFSLSDKLSFGQFIIGAIGAVFGILATLVAVWAIRSNESIAVRSGAFERGILDVSFMGMPITAHGFDVAVGSPFEANTLTMFNLPVSVRNSGQRSIDDVYIVFRYWKEHNLALPADVGTLEGGLGNATRTVSHSGPFEDVTYKVDKLNPGVHMNVNDPIPLHETSMTTDVQTRTKDDVPISVALKVDYAFTVGVSVTATDQPALSYPISIRGIEATDLDELTRKVLESLRQRCTPPQPSSIWQRIFGPTRVIEMQDWILVFPKREKLGGTPEGTVYTAAVDQSQVRLLSYAKEGGIVIVRDLDGKSRVEQLNCTGAASAS